MILVKTDGVFGSSAIVLTILFVIIILGAILLKSDQYRGYDLNHDRIGDIPYHPVSLYSKITEESPYTLMLLHSFFIDLMDQAEKVVPTITPEAFKDESPLMKPLLNDTY